MSVIGKISATQNSPSSTDEFTFWLKDEVVVAPFDLVAVGNASGSTTVGVIKEILHNTDSPSHIANYVSSDFGVVDQVATTPRLGTTYVVAEVVSNDREIYMPLRDGAPVRFANEAQIRMALGIDGIPDSRRIPAGFLKMSNGTSVPVNFDSAFLIGPEGAHLNVSGISGLATKTSYIMFLLQALAQSKESARTAVIIFNVKGADLLHIDQPPIDQPPKESGELARDWEQCGLRAIPFKDVRYFFPFAKRSGNGFANTSASPTERGPMYASGQATNYVYTYDHDREKLDLLLSSFDDPALTIGAILSEITDSRAFDVSDWKALHEKLDEKCRGEGDKSKTIPVQSWRRFKRIISTIVSGHNSGIFQDTRSGFTDYHQSYLSDHIAEIKGGGTYVVDIAQIPDMEKCLVFGDVVRTVYKLKTEKEGDAPDRVIIFVDELNKYAPDAVRSSPILGDLLEITERGRSLGIVLFSAEQFRSEIHARVKGNCATNVYGRTNAVEVGTSDYRPLPKSYTSMMTRLQKGHLIVQHPIFRSLLKVVFPRPAYLQKT
jgi:DNA helicase HerA-like ATPase